MGFLPTVPLLSVYFSLIACAQMHTSATLMVSSNDGARGHDNIESFLRPRNDEQPNSHDHDGTKRNLKIAVMEPRPCDTTIGILNVTEINSMLSTLTKQFFSLKTHKKEVKEISEGMVNTFKYSIEARKICGSCEMFEHHFSVKLENNAFGDFCGPQTYGSKAMFSGLLLLPINEDGSILEGSLKGTIWHRPTNVDENHTPSNNWPDTEKVKHAKNDLTRYEMFGALASASAGFVSIVPDGFGYGESGGDVYKSTLVKKAYQTSTIPLWFQAQHTIALETSCKTNLASSAAVMGYDEGGYAAVASAVALSKIGVKVIKNQPGGGLYQLSSAGILKTLESVINNKYPKTRDFALAFLGFSYSSTNPDLSNSYEGQNMLSHKYMLPTDDEKNILRWYQKGRGYSKIRINSLMPKDTLEIFNPIFVDFVKDALENKITNPCRRHSKTRYIEKLCESLMDNDLTNVIEHTTYPIEFCHGAEDEISSYENVPNFGSNEFLSLYDSVELKGSHAKVELNCLWAGISSFFEEIQFTELPTSNEICLEETSSLDLLEGEKWMFVSIMGAFSLVFVYFLVKPFLRKEKLGYEMVEQSDDAEYETN